MSTITSFSGLASGIDTASIVSGLVAAEKAPLTALQSTKSNLGSVSVRLATLSSKLDALGAAAAALATPSSARTATATSSNANAVGVAVGEGATFGQYAVDVHTRAASHRSYSDAMTSDTASGLFGTGTVTIAVGSGGSANVSVDAGDSLTSVARKINASGLDVTAGVLFDGTGYRLQISGNSTGADQAVTFSESGTTLGLANPANAVQAASDASFSIDGFAMTSRSNTVTSAIPGVTLTLGAVTGDPVNVRVERSTDKLVEKVRAFVDAYNSVSAAIDAESTFRGSARVGDSLSGDSTLRGLQTRLRDRVLSQVSTGSGEFQHLASIGVSLQRDGRLALDASKLTAAAAKDGAAVERMLGGDGTTDGAMGAMRSLTTEYTRAKDGYVSIRRDSLSRRMSAIDSQVERMQARLDTYEANLRARFTTMETLLSKLQSQGSSISALSASLSK